MGVYTRVPVIVLGYPGTCCSIGVPGYLPPYWVPGYLPQYWGTTGTYPNIGYRGTYLSIGVPRIPRTVLGYEGTYPSIGIPGYLPVFPKEAGLVLGYLGVYALLEHTLAVLGTRPAVVAVVVMPPVAVHAGGKMLVDWVQSRR